MRKYIENVSAQTLLTTEELAALLGLHPATLRAWRSNASPVIPYVRIGGSVRYDLADVHDFLARNKEGGAV